MKTKDLLASIENVNARSAWSKGVREYAYEIVEYIAGDYEELDSSNVKEALLNGSFDWSGYSCGGMSLISNEDIAQRLCTVSELKRVKGKKGYVGDKANIRETWLDCQARALRQAYLMVRDIIINNEQSC